MTQTRDIRRHTFLPFLALTLIVEGTLTITGNPLKTDTAPLGIISYELAGSVEKAQVILESWSEPVKRLAAFNLGLDFLFIFAYTITISLACSWAGAVFKNRFSPFAQLSQPLVWGLLLAGSLDVTENLALFLMLMDRATQPWPGIAAWAAIIKFTLVALGLFYTFIGGLTWIFTQSPNLRRSS